MMQVSSSRRARHFGFTLVELLVVIAIIGVLVALLLPAVQSAREASRRIKCNNQLKQLGLAMQNHHDVNGTLPPGALNTSAAVANENFHNWAIGILPYIELQALYSQYDLKQENWRPVNNAVIAQRLGIMLCPSDVNMKEGANVGSGNYSLPSFPGSYKAVAGSYTSNALFWDYPLYFTSAANQLPANDNGTRGALHCTGLQGVTPVRMAMASDGTSNTYIIGEYSTKNTPSRKAFWGNSFTFFSMGAVGPDSATRGLPDYDKCLGLLPTSNQNRCNRAFASFHPAGMGFVFLDGHVQNVANNIAADVWVGLGTIAGSESTSNFQ